MLPILIQLSERIKYEAEECIAPSVVYVLLDCLPDLNISKSETLSKSRKIFRRFLAN